MPATVNPDKTINLNGKKTFLVGLSNVGSETTHNAGKESPTPETMAKYKDFLYVSYVGGTTFLKGNAIPAYVANGLHFIPTGRNSAVDAEVQAMPEMLGYFNCDEPLSKFTQSLYSTTKTQAECLALSRCQGRTPYEWREPNECWTPDEEPQVALQHNAFKNGDPNHLSILNHWGYMTYWNKYSDVISWDTYAVRAVSGMGTTYTREDAMYAYEILSEQSFFRGTDLHSIPQPVIAAIQALGYDYPPSLPTYPNGRMQAMTPTEARCNTYSAICMDVVGIWYWTNFFEHPTGPTEIGLSANPALFTYYSQLAREMRLLNDTLVSPTIGYNWYARGMNTGAVTFSNSITKTVLNKSVNNFSWILKDAIDGKYLIVVNKDTQPITTSITVSGVTSSQATTVGLETVGSGRAGRAIPVSGEQITDTFDGQAVHIYRYPGLTCPTPVCNFTIV